MGTPLREIIEEHAGGMRAGKAFKACLPGGASTRFLPARHLDVEMDFDALRAIGHRLGTGGVIVFSQDVCLVAATLNLVEFFARESCGLCTPCREGLPFIRELLRRIEGGEGRADFVPLLRRMSEQMAKSYCAFAPGAAEPVLGLLDDFVDEVHEHIARRRCPFPKHAEGGDDHA
jgi:NADH-quinone oxidoreductase subunit F